MKTLFIILIIASSVSINNSLFNRNFMGLHKTEISKLIAENNKSFKLNTAYINNAYNYLKYEDKIREITALFFLDDDDYCRMIRIMSDYSNLNDIIEDLNEHYNETGTNLWSYSNSGKNYVVKLEEGDWFFTISIKVDKD